MTRAVKTEHAGAKNGGGYWGKRTEAKERSDQLRRLADSRLVAAALDELAAMGDATPCSWCSGSGFNQHTEICATCGGTGREDDDE